MSVPDSVGASREAPTVGSLPRKRRRLWLRMVDAIFFTGALLLTVIAVSSTIAQPLSPGRTLTYIVLWPMATVVLHRSLAYLERRISSRSTQPVGPASPLIGLAKWLGAPIAAVLVCGTVEAIVEQRATAVVRDDLGPVVRAIEAKLSPSEPVPADIVDALGAAHELSFVVYYPRERVFVLATFGGSIDMDGSTIYYDSQDREWHQFHNDLAETDDPDAARFKAATLDIERIRYRRDGGSWMRAIAQ